MESDELTCPNCLKPQFDLNMAEESKIKCMDCSKDYIYLKCYHCKKKITMKNLEYIDGTNIQCPFPNCAKFFSKSSCAICVKPIFFPDKNQEGSKIKCPFKDCNKEYCKIICPNIDCKAKLFWKDANYREGQIITCSAIRCGKKFQKVNCFHCMRRCVWLDCSYIEGQKIVCPYLECSRQFNKTA